MAKIINVVTTPDGRTHKRSGTKPYSHVVAYPADGTWIIAAWVGSLRLLEAQRRKWAGYHAGVRTFQVKQEGPAAKAAADLPKANRVLECVEPTNIGHIGQYEGWNVNFFVVQPSGFYRAVAYPVKDASWIDRVQVTDPVLEVAIGKCCAEISERNRQRKELAR